MLDELADLVNANERQVRRGRYPSTTFLVETGDTAWLVTVIEGRIARLERGPFLKREWPVIMPEIGHFPMSENPEQFRRHILPVLDEIRAST